MIYFKNINLVNGFLQNVLINKEKSENISGWGGLPSKIYLKNSTKLYQNTQEIIEELKERELLFEVIEFQGPFCTEPKSHGFILNDTRLNTLLSAGEVIIDYQTNKHALLTLNQACDLLNISRPTLYKLMSNGELDYLEIFGKKRIQVNEIMRYISMKSVKGKPQNN